MGEETTYAYDAAGNLVEKIDAKNQKTEYGYDDAGRLVQIRYYAAGDHIMPVKTLDFNYDATGYLKSYSDGTTSGTYIYDDLHRKIAETVDYGAFQLSYGYSYYKNGVKSSFIAPDGTEYTYTYDDSNQLTSVQIPGVGAITVNAYQWNKPSSVTVPGGTTRTYTYDPFMRVKQITSTDPGGNGLMGYQYDFDRMDNITAKATEHGAYNYNYDNLYRLISSKNPQSDDENFTYDQVGNRMTSTASNGTWGYNPNNELLGYDTVSFTYDDNGNLVSKSDGTTVTNYIYNVEDRLSRVEDGNGQVIGSYYYDPFGRRLWKEVNGVKTYFLYSDEGLIGEFDALGSELKSYGWKPESTWTTDPLFLRENGQIYFYHNDRLGTPQQLTSVSGAVVWKAVYNVFGEAYVDPASTVTNNFRFPGQYYDEETGLHYNHHRYYDPSIGRYLTPDPVGLDGGINPFVYVENNPIRWIDPLGLMRLPGDPSGLPPEWTPDPSHKDPNGERWRHPDGDYLDYHKGRPGEPGWKGKDHWHHNGKKKHLPPGEEIPDPGSDSDPNNEMCGENCKRVLRIVRDTVTGVITVITIIVCSQSPVAS